MPTVIKKIENLLLNAKVFLILYVLVAAGIGFQMYFLEGRQILATHPAYTQYNNYIIFKQSFFHLTQQKDLYRLYLDECWDYYKYSPTFSLLFGFFAVLPNLIGLIFWNLLNALIIFFAVQFIPNISIKKKNIILIFALAELITSLQNSQSNGLMAGLLIFTFALLENKKYFLATLCAVISVYLKIFGLIGFVLFIFYDDKWKLILYSLFWSIILLLLPLIVVSPHQLFFLYERWLILLKLDRSGAITLSVANWLHTWFSVDIKNSVLLFIGAILLLLPLTRIQQYKNFYFRLLMLSSLLIWSVIFNHKAESPTFIIAIMGVSIWYFSTKRKLTDTILVIAALLFTSLSTSDIFPPFIRHHYFIPYVIKVVPCILVWIKIVYEQLTKKTEDTICS